MSIDLICKRCGAQLRLEDQYVGQQAICPACKAQFQVPAPEGLDNHNGGRKNDSDTANQPDQWSMITPDGSIYGPVGKATIDRWAAEGRIDVGCRIRHRNATWQEAASFYPDLIERSATDSSPASEQVTTSSVPADQQSTAQSFTPRPHRAGLVLGLGIAGLLLGCPIPSLVAWFLGSEDLAQMRAGRMNQSGYQMTQAGRYLGLAVVVLWMIALVPLIGFLLARLA